MESVLQLTFTTEGGKSFTLSVDDPKETLTAEEVAQAMTGLIDGTVFAVEGQPLAGIRSARIVERSIKELIST